MDFEPKTQARIVKLFEHKICSSCGDPAERYFHSKTYCQSCFLVQKIKEQDEREARIREFVPKVFNDPRVL
jgi:hypothetical protein